MLWCNFDFPLFQLWSLPFNNMDNGKIPMAVQETGDQRWEVLIYLFIYLCVLTNYFFLSYR